MATYKLMQDIEADDHILGPLSLRQFIFALIAVFFFYISFIAITKHGQFFLVVTLPPALFFAFFAFPFGRDQPTEIWALAKLRFWFKSRRRIWDQDGMKELVTVTVPKKIEHIYTDGLSQTEVKSRLSALANTIDSRGWAVKNVGVNAYTQAGVMTGTGSDRLISIGSMPQEVPNDDVHASDDILDEVSNPIAHQFDQMITQSAQTHRQQLVDAMNSPVSAPQPTAKPPADYWFMNNGAQQIPLPAAPQAGASSAAEEAALAAQLSGRGSQITANSHLRTLQPMSDTPTAPSQSVSQAFQIDQSSEPAANALSVPAPQTASANDTDAAILSLANNNDLNVATLAREAQKAKDGGGLPDDEVVISLHGSRTG